MSCDKLIESLLMFLSFFFSVWKICIGGTTGFSHDKARFSLSIESCGCGAYKLERSRDSLYGTKACKNEKLSQKAFKPIERDLTALSAFFPDQSSLMLDLKWISFILCLLNIKDFMKSIQVTHSSCTFKFHVQTAHSRCFLSFRRFSVLLIDIDIWNSSKLHE